MILSLCLTLHTHTHAPSDRDVTGERKAAARLPLPPSLHPDSSGVSTPKNPYWPLKIQTSKTSAWVLGSPLVGQREKPKKQPQTPKAVSEGRK